MTLRERWRRTTIANKLIAVFTVISAGAAGAYFLLELSKRTAIVTASIAFSPDKQWIIVHVLNSGETASSNVALKGGLLHFRAGTTAANGKAIALGNTNTEVPAKALLELGRFPYPLTADELSAMNDGDQALGIGADLTYSNGWWNTNKTYCWVYQFDGVWQNCPVTSDKAAGAAWILNRMRQNKRPNPSPTPATKGK